MKSTFLILVGVAVIWGGFRFLYSLAISAATEDQSSCLVLLGSTTSEENNLTYIVGTVRNDCGRRFLNVTVNFKVARQATDTMPEMFVTANATNLASGETMSFKTRGFASHGGYQFDSIRGF